MDDFILDAAVRLMNRAEMDEECLVVPGLSVYPSVRVRREDGWRVARGSRVVWESVHGPIPRGLVVRHTCDNKRCVNPNHLIIGTYSQNLDDAWERGLRNRARQPERCKRGHDLSVHGSWRKVRNGRYFACKACYADHQRKHKERKKSRGLL